MLGEVKTIIVDEIHALADNKRGAHLTLSLERLYALTKIPPLELVYLLLKNHWSWWKIS
ncbi:hypothetical protein [Legionella oakridgensis]|uniref:Helicase ATP-binding domain-containing protein n=2 Tax=Legionella oakridgensis TaxID=29423 RepID=W0BC33_9GAMM|nr:hypothetical protein [Legionella oakridgensis]AHE68098.1 hypothetical protein Loa_02561 [Legionella oakridgensis ATCC 33761 = DSM 21215]KTD42551.1 helicase, DEAD/DEAH box family [Legionella oakridgensis]STY21075.1 helicase, DEAD/DEAH box family [Legionella longbeachae]